MITITSRQTTMSSKGSIYNNAARRNSDNCRWITHLRYLV
jgi:hypothetical protein